MNERDSWRATGRRALRVARQRGWLGPSSALPARPGSTPAVALLFAVPAAVFGLLLALTLAGSWFSFLGQGPKDHRPPEEYFKYGSIGNEATDGLPYLVWLVLPEVFSEYLPGSGAGAEAGARGYAAFGFAYEPGRESPIGFSVKTVGFPRIAINCAVCHTGTFRTAPDAPPTIVPTAPAVRMDSQAYLRFLFRCAEDPRFTADTLLPAIEARPGARLSPIDRALYRHLIIPLTRSALLKLKERYAWTKSRPLWGPGRIDPFNPVKFNQLGLNPDKDRTIGNSDMQPLWNMARHEGYSLHWDGLNNSLTEVVLTGAIGDGATPKTLPVGDLRRLEAWLRTVPPPAYPFPIDRELAARGEPVFQRLCASCHAFGGERTGTVIPLAEVGTDRHRLDMWTMQAATRYNNYAADRPWRFERFVKTDGYASVAMDGLWLRAPYLHNGSVPTLEDLLEPVANRPTVFFRGYDVYDRQRTGFVHQGPEAERNGFRYDTRVPGNGNAGHEGEAYGTTLSPDEKRALIEYLKTQ